MRTSCITIQDVASIEGFLLLLQNIQVEGGSVSHFVVIIHYTPERKVENFLQCKTAESTRMNPGD